MRCYHMQEDCSQLLLVFCHFLWHLTINIDISLWLPKEFLTVTKMEILSMKINSHFGNMLNIQYLIGLM